MFDYEAVKRFYFEKGHADSNGKGRFESAFFHTIEMVHDTVRAQTLAESASHIAALQADIKTLCAALKTTSEGNAKLMALLPAAEAVIERWDTPAWKDVPHTGEFIARLRGAVLAAGGKTTCRSEMDSEEAWSDYLHRADEKEAHDAIGEVLMFARHFERKHAPWGDRMHKMFDAGAAIYAERFGSEWVPF